MDLITLLIKNILKQSLNMKWTEGTVWAQSLEKVMLWGLFFSIEAWADLITSSLCSILMFQAAWGHTAHFTNHFTILQYALLHYSIICGKALFKTIVVHVIFLSAEMIKKDKWKVAFVFEKETYSSERLCQRSNKNTIICLLGLQI